MTHIKHAVLLCFAFVLGGCVSTTTKEAAFPAMYDVNKPLSVVIAPVINNTTAAEASDYLNATVAQPLADKGYYVLPVPVIADIFKQSGVIDGAQLKSAPMQVFKEKFGADAVMFITLTQWETNYIVVGGNVVVGMEYALVSTATSEVIWSNTSVVQVDTGSNSGNLLVDIIATAITTAATDYVPIARQVHNTATMTVPVGKYHPRHGKDGKDKNVNPELAAYAEQQFRL
ncbi:MAG: DUF799 domain-containing protein [Shewanella sp.]|nr:DUF799 domain-containing protein [Shewanella sp.]